MSLSRYRWGARCYDLLSGERLVYRRGRRAACELLDLRPGDRVLVIGCGTGFDLPLLTEAVGPTGTIVGVDSSREMLRVAERKVTEHGWGQVRLVLTDAADLSGVSGEFDAVLFTYSLSIIDDWRGAWDAAVSRLVPGGKAAVVDTDWPTGFGRVFIPLAVLALWAGGVHRRRQVWRLVSGQADDAVHRRLMLGHIHVAVGSITDTNASEGST